MTHLRRRLRGVLWTAAVGFGAAGFLTGCVDVEEPGPDTGLPTYNLELNLTNFTPHRSQKIEGRVVDLASGAEVGRTSVTGDTTVTVFFGKILTKGRSYRIDFYADFDRNENYTPPVNDPATSFPDHQWRLTATSTDAEGVAGLANVGADVSVTMSHNANWVDIDWPGMEANSGVVHRRLTLNLTGFNPHNGQRIEARAVNLADEKEAGRVVVIGAPTVSLDFGRILATGGSYRIDFYADFDRNNEYTPPVGSPPTAFPDHQWRLTSESTNADGAAGLANVSGDVVVTMAHNATWTDIDWPGMEPNVETGLRALTLRLTGFNPHTGQKIEGRVVNTHTNEEVGRASVTGAPEATLDFGKILMDGHEYRIDFYADLSGDGAYTPPVGQEAFTFPDHQWRLTAASTDAQGVGGLSNVSRDVEITMAHNANWVDIDWPGSEQNQ